MSVRRFDFSQGNYDRAEPAEMYEHESGDYVPFYDYEELQTQLAALKEENEAFRQERKDLIGELHRLSLVEQSLKARVAELEKERQTLADAAYSAIIAFNNLQDESLDGEARAHALLKHTDCIRNLWNTFATQDNARFKEPANEG